ncbi:hypothetical protein L1887_48070 [Cichorium endivia]|nr:hypothetical protein L1887_48070 [Cichorium endivia]
MFRSRSIKLEEPRRAVELGLADSHNALGSVEGREAVSAGGFEFNGGPEASITPFKFMEGRPCGHCIACSCAAALAAAEHISLAPAQLVCFHAMLFCLRCSPVTVIRAEQKKTAFCCAFFGASFVRSEMAACGAHSGSYLGLARPAEHGPMHA